MNIEQSNDVPEDDADEAQLPLPEDGPSESDDVEESDMTAGSMSADGQDTQPADGPEMSSSDVPADDVGPIDVDPQSPSDAPSAPNKPEHGWDPRIDWSQMKPAPGYEDPATGKIRFLPMGVDESGIALADLMQGRRRVFDPEIVPPELGAPPPLPFFASPAGDGGGKSLLPGGRPGQGPAPLVQVDVQVSFTPEGTRRVRRDVLQSAAEFSRTEIRIVGQKLTDHMDDQRRLENARRTAWGR